MFSLSLSERLLVSAVLSAVVLGVTVKHWRDAHRERAARGGVVPVVVQTVPGTDASFTQP